MTTGVVRVFTIVRRPGKHPYTYLEKVHIEDLTRQSAREWRILELSRGGGNTTSLSIPS